MTSKPLQFNLIVLNKKTILILLIIFNLNHLYGQVSILRKFKTNDIKNNTWEISDKLLNSLGGVDIWASTKILYIKELAFPSKIKDTVIAEFWRDLEKPSYRSLITGPNFSRETCWTEKDGWIKHNGVRKKMSKETIKEELSNWYQEPYVIYHKLAIRDQSIKVKMIGENRLEIYKTDTNKLLCWFELDATGSLLMWGNYYNGVINEHVYGPIKQIGKFKMPAWGASTNGDWRFEYLKFKSIKKMSCLDN